MTYVSSRVARLTPMISTPVAIGSRVPPCPTRRVRASLLIRATTSWEVIPAGLSTTISPSTFTTPPNQTALVAGQAGVRLPAPSAGGAEHRPAGSTPADQQEHQPDQREQGQPEPYSRQPPVQRVRQPDGR